MEHDESLNSQNQKSEMDLLVLYWDKKRHRGESHKIGHKIFDRDATAILWKQQKNLAALNYTTIN